MVTALDFAYALMFVAAFPLLDRFGFMPAYRRRAALDAPRAWAWFWNLTVASLWIATALGAALWIGKSRPWSQLGFTMPGGWRAWCALGLLGLFVLQNALSIRKVWRSEKARASARKQFLGLGEAGRLLPATQPQFAQWVGVSLTAGFCEEFLFRGYLIWVLAPFLGWWGAAAVSVVCFAVAHAYQGGKGILTTGILGAVLTATVAVFQSLLPAIALHMLMDLGAGCIAWLAFREGQKGA